MQLETNEKYRRPGAVLIATGIALLIARLVVGWIPLVGGMLGIFCLVGGIVGLVGGAFLMLTKGKG